MNSIESHFNQFARASADHVAKSYLGAAPSKAKTRVLACEEIALPLLARPVKRHANAPVAARHARRPSPEVSAVPNSPWWDALYFVSASAGGKLGQDAGGPVGMAIGAMAGGVLAHAVTKAFKPPAAPTPETPSPKENLLGTRLPIELIQAIADQAPEAAAGLAMTSKQLRFNALGEQRATVALIGKRCNTLRNRRKVYLDAVADLRFIESIPFIGNQSATRLAQSEDYAHSLEGGQPPVGAIVELLGSPADGANHNGSGAYGLVDINLRQMALKAVEDVLKDFQIKTGGDQSQHPIALSGEDALDLPAVLRALIPYAKSDSDFADLWGIPADGLGEIALR